MQATWYPSFVRPGRRGQSGVIYRSALDRLGARLLPIRQEVLAATFDGSQVRAARAAALGSLGFVASVAPALLHALFDAPDFDQDGRDEHQANHQRLHRDHPATNYRKLTINCLKFSQGGKIIKCALLTMANTAPGRSR